MERNRSDHWKDSGRAELRVCGVCLPRKRPLDGYHFPLPKGCERQASSALCPAPQCDNALHEYIRIINCLKPKKMQCTRSGWWSRSSTDSFRSISSLFIPGRLGELHFYYRSADGYGHQCPQSLSALPLDANKKRQKHILFLLICLVTQRPPLSEVLFT